MISMRLKGLSIIQALLLEKKNKKKKNTSCLVNIIGIHAVLHDVHKVYKLHVQGCQKFRAQIAANFTKSRGRQRKSSPIFPKLKCLNLGALCVKLTKNHPKWAEKQQTVQLPEVEDNHFRSFSMALYDVLILSICD